MMPYRMLTCFLHTLSRNVNGTECSLIHFRHLFIIIVRMLLMNVLVVIPLLLHLRVPLALYSRIIHLVLVKVGCRKWYMLWLCTLRSWWPVRLCTLQSWWSILQTLCKCSWLLYWYNLLSWHLLWIGSLICRYILICHLLRSLWLLCPMLPILWYSGPLMMSCRCCGCCCKSGFIV